MSVCMSVCPHDSTQELVDGFGLNMVWTLCHWGLHVIAVLNFLQSVIPRWWMNKLLRWDQH
jgi:hypothetical protein